MGTRRNLARIVGLVVVSLIAITVVQSAVASAATWTVEGKKLSEGTANGLASEAALEIGTTATFKGKVLGQEFVLTAKKVSSSSGTIFQEGTKAKSSGAYEFSELTVDKPAGCTVSSPIKTNAMTGELVDHSGSSDLFEKFVPEEGETIATIKISGCAIAGSYPLKGTFYGEDGIWGLIRRILGLNINGTVNTTLSGTITFAGGCIDFSASISITLSTGKEFGADT